MDINDLDRLIEGLSGVRRTSANGLAHWHLDGRVVARQLDDNHVVIRADFDFRDQLLRQFPDTFSAPAAFAKHMMVVADFAVGDPGAIEDAAEAGWLLQRRGR